MTNPEGSGDRVRKLREERDRLSVLITAVENGLWDYIVKREGKYGDGMLASDVAIMLGVSQQAANNHLARLYRVGFLDRERIPVNGGGRAFAYHPSKLANRGVVDYKELSARLLQTEVNLTTAISALKTIRGPEDRGPWMDLYRDAGGGYEGLQAIAQYALDRLDPEPEGGE